MKKLIFKNLAKNVLGFFLITSISMTIIVWVIQAVNLLEFVSEDGHSFKVYFMFSILNLPKIFSKILPFMFFISLFYILSKYEEKNELLIFWLSGIHKMEFLKNLMIYSLFFLFFQIFLTTYFVPKTQDMARSYIRGSTMDYFPNLVKEKKFIDAISNITIYIENKDQDGMLNNIFLKEKKSRTDGKYHKNIYAKKGYIKKKGTEHWLIMNDGKIINYKDNQSTIISFEETQINLSTYSSKTTTFPKIKEMKTMTLLSCIKALHFNKPYMSEDRFLTCKDNVNISVSTEVLRRLYLPFYLPVLALVIGFLSLTSKDKINYKRFRLNIFFICAIIIVISEMSLSLPITSSKNILAFFLIPITLFIISIFLFKKKVKHN